MSYANMIMYGSVIPSYKSNKKDQKKNDENEVINADDPRNRERVRSILYDE